MLYFTVLYYTVLYYTILYFTMLYNTIPPGLESAEFLLGGASRIPGERRRGDAGTAAFRDVCRARNRSKIDSTLSGIPPYITHCHDAASDLIIFVRRILRMSWYKGAVTCHCHWFNQQKQRLAGQVAAWECNKGHHVL